jgi:CheY-like chemotaxis protein
VRARILVAEDIDMNQLVIDGLLTAAGHRVTIVSDGAAAVRAVQADDFDLVLMDLEMPGMDGLAATEAIRRLGDGVRGVPVIALSANAMPEVIARCKAAGMNDHVAKPIDREALLATIARWLGQEVAAPGAAPTAASVPVIDDMRLQELERLLGRPKVVEFVSRFRGKLAKAVGTITTTADRERLAWEAHGLISFAGNLGCLQLTECGRGLLQALHEGRDDLPPRIAEIAAAADRALAAMNQRYPG